jgi:dolichol kinase
MVAAVGAICEALPLRLDDNLTIPLIVGFATWGVATVLGLPLG